MVALLKKKPGEFKAIDSGQETFTFDPAAWDDLRFSLDAASLDSIVGRLDYDFENCGVLAQTNATYPDNPICMIVQFPHAKKLGTDINPHIHWIQNQNATPNLLMEYRWINNGGEVVTYQKAISSGAIFPYVSGNLLQICSWPDISPPVGEKVSSMMDVRLFRDTTNASGLFAGADTYTGDVLLKEFDIHYETNRNGSTNRWG